MLFKRRRSHGESEQLATQRIRSDQVLVRADRVLSERRQRDALGVDLSNMERDIGGDNGRPTH